MTIPLTPAVASNPTPTSNQAALNPTAVRIWGGFMAIPSAAMLGVGLYLRPDTVHGLGTHQQLGLPPCGFYHATGIPCPMCGCTTAVSLFSHGHVLSSIATQPFGAAVALLALILIILGTVGALTGRWFGPHPFTLQWHATRILLGSAAFLMIAWVYKIAITLHQMT